MKVRFFSTVLVISAGAALLSGCLVLGAPHSAYMRSHLKNRDSVQLHSFPSGFYRYTYNPSVANPDSVTIEYPLAGKAVKMQWETYFYAYRLKAKTNEREQLSPAIIRTYAAGQQFIDTLHFQGDLRKF
jgi:hypothetical protein